MPLALLSLTLSAFAIGTTEFVIVGLIPIISQDLNVDLPSAGLLISLYAIGVAIGAPLLTAVAGRFRRKNVLIGLIALFIVGNILAYLSVDYNILVIARILTGLAHGVFFAVGSTIATSLVPKEKEASAIAIMFTGLTVALVTGVPLGTWIGQEFGWRAVFLLVSFLGLLSLIGSFVLIPNSIKENNSANFSHKIQVLRQGRLLLVFAMTAIGYGGTFVAFTFFAPILENISGFDSSAISIIMLLYGASVAVGNVLGGKLADKFGPITTLKYIFTFLSIILFLFTFTASNQIGAIITVLFWGAFAFGNVPGLQVYVVQLAEKYTPEAVDVASGFNIAAFNIGIALGAVIGGFIIEEMQLIDVPWVGAVIVVFALILTCISGSLDRHNRVASS